MQCALGCTKALKTAHNTITIILDVAYFDWSRLAELGLNVVAWVRTVSHRKYDYLVDELASELIFEYNSHTPNATLLVISEAEAYARYVAQKNVARR